MKKSAITRIIIYSLLAVILVSVLGAALTIHMGGGWRQVARILDDDFDDDLDEVREAQSFVTAQQSQELSFLPQEVREIQIQWVAGDLTVVTGDVDRIEVKESESDTPMVYSLREGELEIRFRKGLTKNLTDFSGKKEPKDLTITVPKNWYGQEIEINSVSTDAEIRDMTLETFEYQGMSGNCTIQNCSIREMDVDGMSLSVNMQGEVRELDIDGTSVSCEFDLINAPREIEMDGVSCSLELILPENAGFSVDMHGLSKNLDTDFAVTTRNGRTVAGDGSCLIDVDGISGNVKILKAAE